MVWEVMGPNTKGLMAMTRTLAFMLGEMGDAEGFWRHF